MRLIDSDSMKADLLTVDPRYEGMIKWCITVLDAQPTIEGRKTGKWIHGDYELGIDGYRCDKCGFFVPWDYVNVNKFINYIEDYNFCPSCGADMRGET